jgi:hypothetical protein
MKASKCWEVGQTRSRRGISMKMRMKEEMLEGGCQYVSHAAVREEW